MKININQADCLCVDKTVFNVKLCFMTTWVFIFIALLISAVSYDNSVLIGMISENWEHSYVAEKVLIRTTNTTS